MKQNICRPIIFYNNFLPAVKESQGWEYCAFGTFDGVKVDTPIVSESTRDILLEVWNYQKEIVRTLKRKYTSQIVYALCYTEIEREESFWNNDSLPFTFFCHLQFIHESGTLHENLVKLGERIKEIGNVDAMTYVTYDNSDFMFVVKAESYELGAGIINSMHQRVNFSFDNKTVCELKNSFTVFAIKQSYIDSTHDHKVYARLNQTKIDLVSIRIIERGSGKIKKLRSMIEEKMGDACGHIRSITPVMGTDDVVIVFEQIGWGDFLKLYCEEEGIFHNTSDIYESIIAGATTTINTSLVECNIFSTDELIDREGDSIQEKRDILRQYVEKMSNKLTRLESKLIDKDVYKELYIILNVLPKFSEEIFSDYVFFAILKPINTLLDLMEEGLNDSYYEFVKSFNRYIQSSIKSDRQAIQVMDFNTKIYDLPVKLHAFYIAYIYRVSEILNTEQESEGKPTYDFLIVPGATNIVNIIELYQKVLINKKLMRVEIPENRFYDVCNVMIIFTHEASHYVGNELRNREMRYGCVLKSIASVYVDYIKSYWDEEPVNNVLVDDAEWKNSKERMEQTLRRVLKSEQNERFLTTIQIGEGENNESHAERIARNNKQYKHYFSFLKENLYRDMVNIVEDRIPNIFGGFAFNQDDETRMGVWKFIREASEHFLVKYEEGTSRLTLDTILEQLNNLYRESFADLMSIAVLRLDAKDYLNSIIKENEQQQKNIETLCRSEAVYRVTLILDVMCRSENNMLDRLNFFEADEYLVMRCTLLSAVKKIRDYIKDGWSKHYDSNAYRNCCVYALFDKMIYDDALRYLCSCLNLYNKKFQESSRVREISNKLNELYCQYREENNIEKQTEAMEEFIYEYKRDLYKEIKNS